MSLLLLVCAKGHQWRQDLTGCLPEAGVPLRCPVCGQPALTLSWDGPGRSEEVAGDCLTPPPARREPDDPASQLPCVPGYEVLGKVGQGGMGVVYKASQSALKRTVALKMIRTGPDAEADELARFRGEAEAVARLRHPHVVQIYEIGEWAGTPFISLEFMDGGSLAARLHDAPLPPRAAAELVSRLAEATHEAHEAGVIHRDLKPANVLLTADGTPKISDFGLAKRLDVDAGHTPTGAVLGTPSYMAPEQAAGAPAAPAADIYSLGAVLYECVTGVPPFRGTTLLETLAQVRWLDLVPPSRLQPKVPADLETVCLKCLQKKPERRYATARQLTQDLLRFLGGQPIIARPVGLWERMAKWAIRRPAVAVLVGVLSFVPVFLAAVVVERSVQIGKVEHDRDVEHGSALAEHERAVAALLRERDTAYAQSLALADREWAAGNPSRAAQLLDECPPDLRGWEWHCLKRLRQRDPLQVQGPASDVVGMTFSPDGKLLAGASRSEVKVWDAETGQERLTLPNALGCVAFGPDGKELAAGARDNTVRVWDLTGRELRSLRGHTTAVASVAYGPDGKTLTGVSTDGTVKVWDAAGQEGLSWKSGQEGKWRKAISPDGRYVLAGVERSVRVWEFTLWDTSSGQATQTFQAEAGPVAAVACDPGGRRMVLYDTGWAEIQVWEVATRNKVTTLRGHPGQVGGLTFSPDGKRLAIAGVDQTVSVWDATSGVRLLTLRGHTGAVLSVAFSRGGERLAAGGADKTVRVWDGTPTEDRLWQAVPRDRDGRP